MTNDEILIRQAIAAEADQAVDPGAVLAALTDGTRPRRGRTGLVAVAGIAVAAGVAAVAVPLLSSRDDVSAPPAASNVTQPPTQIAEQNILLVGIDDSAYADSVMLVRRRADGSFRALSLPRDTYVTVPNRGDTKLNKAYVYGANTAADPKVFDPARAKVMTDTVSALTGVAVDHYAMVNMTGFGKLADAIGGVEVCLKAAVTDTFSGIRLPAGRQTLTGANTLAFLRQRHGLPKGDLDRGVRQQVFLRSMITKLAGQKDFTALAKVVRENVWVDQSWDILQFANQLVAGAGMDTATIPYTNVTMQTPREGNAIGVDPVAVRAFAAEFLAGGSAAGAGGGQEDSCVS
jgi:LCP family protein required for cell wall assembly